MIARPQSHYLEKGFTLVEIIQQQEGSSIADIQQTFDNLLDSLDTLCNEDFKAIENEINADDKNHASVINGYVREVMKTVDFSN